MGTASIPPPVVNRQENNRLVELEAIPGANLTLTRTSSPESRIHMNSLAQTLGQLWSCFQKVGQVIGCKPKFVPEPSVQIAGLRLARAAIGITCNFSPAFGGPYEPCSIGCHRQERLNPFRLLVDARTRAPPSDASETQQTRDPSPAYAPYKVQSENPRVPLALRVATLGPACIGVRIQSATKARAAGSIAAEAQEVFCVRARAGVGLGAQRCALPHDR